VAKQEGVAKVSGGVNLLAVPGSYACYRGSKVAEIIRATLEDFDPSGVSGVLDALQSVLSRATRVTDLVGKLVLFLLPSPGGGGGAHSVVQELIGLRRCGVDARIANLVSNRHAFEQNYPEACGFVSYHSSDDDLLELAHGSAIVVATSYASVSSLKAIVDQNPAAVPLYYVQDYEPWFFQEHAAQHAVAKASYTLVPNARAFAKTQWLCRTVNRMAGIEVTKIDPSLNRSLYNGLVVDRGRSGPIAITSMIRPNSARRNPGGSLNLLRTIKQKYGSAVDIRIFGCADEELDQLEEAQGFDFVNFGELKRAEVAGVLRGADIFVDLSTTQAFGCTGLEAIAVGCATVLPRGSGVEEYAKDGQNCLLVDTTNDAEAAAAVERLIADNRAGGRFRSDNLGTSLRYSVRTAVWSLLLLFGSALDECDMVVDKG
jgi:hypothetical protein